MSRRRAAMAGAAAVLAVVAGMRLVERPGRSDAASGSVLPTSTATVQRTTLVDQEELDGTLRYGDERDVVAQAQGTLSALPAEGGTVERNGVLYEVDGRAVRLLFGERPAWRPFVTGMSAGADVRQLEENLVALGHGSRRALGVDERFTAATAAAVERWEKAVGMEQDGVIGLGEVVFLPEAVRVSRHRATVGEPVQPGAPVLTASSVTKVVAVDLEADRRSLLKAGDKVEIELPDGARTPGTVASVGATATEPDSGDDSGGGGEATVEVVVAVDDQSAIGDLDGAPVDVHVTRDRAEGVLAVPVNALLALAEGGYAVEVVERAGAPTRLLAVEVGVFARGLVEVRGDGLGEGDRVVVPA